MDKRLVDEINKQITYEFYSAFLYLSMASYCAENDLPGFESWFKVQKDEEEFHANKFLDYLHERDEHAIITGFDNPPEEFTSLLDALEKSLEHEKFVTSRISFLLDIAYDIKDYAAIEFLNWFIKEQIEEESSFNTLIGQVKLIGDKGPGIFQLDREAGARVFTPPIA